MRVRPAAFLDRRHACCRRRCDGGSMDAGRGRGHPRAERSRLLCLRHERPVRRCAEDPSRRRRMSFERCDARAARGRRRPCRPFLLRAGLRGRRRARTGADAVEWRSHSKALAAAMNEWPIVREQSFFVGLDRDDIEAARSAGISSHVFDGADLAALVHSLLGRSVNDRAAAEPRKA